MTAPQSSGHEQDLLRAYAALGQHVFRDKAMRGQFQKETADLVKCIELRRALSPDDKAGKKKLETRTARGCAALGAAAYAKHGEAAGPKELTDRIKSVLVKPVGPHSPPPPSLRENASRVSTLLQSTPILILSSILCPPVGLLLIWMHPSWTRLTKTAWMVAPVAILLMAALVVRLLPGPDGTLPLSDALETPTLSSRGSAASTRLRETSHSIKVGMTEEDVRHLMKAEPDMQWKTPDDNGFRLSWDTGGLGVVVHFNTNPTNAEREVTFVSEGDSGHYIRRQAD